MREGYLANKVGHPGAVSILDDDVDVDGTVFLVMELLEGQTLESCREAGSIKPDELLVVAYRALDVLTAAHARQIVHRDLKPANLFVCGDGSIRILDFGIARLTSAPTPNGGTGRDTALGTPGYMPPEQARGRWEAVDGQSDLWALGATLFAVLSGRPVHEAGTTNEQLLAAMTLPAPPLARVAPSAPAELQAIVDRALAFEKHERWPDAASMQAAVARAYEKLTGRTIANAPTLSSALRRRSAHPEAPTLAVTNHAVSNPAGEKGRSARGWLLPVGLAAALGLGLLVLATRGSRTTGTAAGHAASIGSIGSIGSPASDLSASAASVASAASAASVPSAAPSATASVTGPTTESPASARPKSSRNGPPARAPSAEKPAASTPPSADPFTRRK